MKGIMAFLAVVVGVAVAVPVFAKNTFTVEDREVSVKFEQQGNELSAAGRVSGGGPCKQLNVDVYFDNSEKSSTAHVEAPIKNYKGESYKGGQVFKAATMVRMPDEYRRGWYVSDVYLKCLQ